jgi:hypothetical protein
MVIFQRIPHAFSEDELLEASEKGWKRRFDGEDPMYFVSHNSILTVVKAGPHIIRLTHLPHRYSDDDHYALANLPQAEQKNAWNEHRAIVLLDLFNDLSESEKRISDREAYASLARLAIELGDSNCAAVYLPGRNIMFPNDGTAEEGLRVMINKAHPLI